MRRRRRSGSGRRLSESAACAAKTRVAWWGEGGHGGVLDHVRLEGVGGVCG